MLNVTVIGTVRDDSGHLQSGSYIVEYKDRDRIVGPITTDNNQINFNIGDHAHLGCSGTMRTGEVLYVEFTNNTGKKFARRMYQYSGENVVTLDIISKADWGLSVNPKITSSTDGVYDIEANGTGTTNNFRVYICGNSVFEDSPSINNWTLVKSISTVEDCVAIAFTKNILAKIEVETITSGHVSDTYTEILSITVGGDMPRVIPHVYMIEWE